MTLGYCMAEESEEEEEEEESRKCSRFFFCNSKFVHSSFTTILSCRQPRPSPPNTYSSSATTLAVRFLQHLQLNFPNVKV